MWKSNAAAGLCAGILIAAAGCSQSPSQVESGGAPAQTPGLTALDYHEIEQLGRRYALALDTCFNDGYDYADLYAEDGEFIDKFSPDGFSKGGVVRAKGREQLARAAGGGSDGCKKAPEGEISTPTNGGSVAWNGWSHLMENHIITPTADGAAGKVYLVMLGGPKGPEAVTRDGGYEDVYVKTPAGWRIKQRTHVRTREWHNPILKTPDMR
jgi:hypothetical protein